MMTDQQKDKANLFTALHKQAKMFVLPNAWSTGSALIFQKQGFAAVATSSAAIAYDLGYSDGEDMAFEDLLRIVEKMANRLDIPLSVDFERGYGESAEEVRENARQLLLAGAVGINIEDGLPDGSLTPLPVQLDKIRALSSLKEELDIDFVINARTCAYWLNVGDDKEKLQIATERGNAFVQAGADCIFIPGNMTVATLSKLVTQIPAPINALLNRQFSDFRQLARTGVRRLSVGSSPARAIYGKLITLAEKLRQGDASGLLDTRFSYDEANHYFANQTKRRPD